MNYKERERELNYRRIGLEAGRQNAIDKNLDPAIVADYDFKLEELGKEVQAFYNSMEVSHEEN